MTKREDLPAHDVPMRLLIMGNPVAKAFAIIGDAWTQLILREAFYGARRFSVWRERLNIPRSVLTDRLKRLVEVGVLDERGVGGGSTRTEYHLSEMGLDLFGVAVIQGQWERRWASSPLQDRYALTFYDRLSGARVEPAVFDHERGQVVDPRHIGWEAREGLEAIPAPTSRRRRTQPIETDRPMIDRSTDVMGDYWSWGVLAAAFFRLRRFDAIHEALGVATNILADRLNRLVLHGILRKDLYQKTPPRFEYRLTEAGARSVSHDYRHARLERAVAVPRWVSPAPDRQTDRRARDPGGLRRANGRRSRSPTSAVGDARRRHNEVLIPTGWRSRLPARAS